MPPRRKPKEGLHRMDAAFSVLCPMGFAKTSVRKTVNSLLKPKYVQPKYVQSQGLCDHMKRQGIVFQVYGGTDGWTFIEEASYKLVVDTILEEQEKAEAENSEQKLAEGSTPEVETLGQSDNPSTQYTQDEPPWNQFLPADKSPEEGQSEHTNSEAPMDIEPCQTQDSLRDKAAAEKRIQLMLPGVVYPSRCSGPATGFRYIKKRKPCYGWISWEDEEEAAAYLNQAP